MVLRPQRRCRPAAATTPYRDGGGVLTAYWWWSRPPIGIGGWGARREGAVVRTDRAAVAGAGRGKRLLGEHAGGTACGHRRGIGGNVIDAVRHGEERIAATGHCGGGLRQRARTVVQPHRLPNDARAAAQQVAIRVFEHRAGDGGRVRGAARGQKDQQSKARQDLRPTARIGAGRGPGKQT